MASRSSRRKSVLSAGREQVAKLLQDGKSVIDPSPEEREAARELAGMKLVEVDARAFVRCADPGDEDYSRSNRTCRGRVYLPDGASTDAEELQCPECGRRVYPAYYRKNRHDELRVRVLPKGVATFVHSRLVAMSYRVEPVVEGVYRVPAGSTGVYVCIWELCAEGRFLARDWAVTQPTCYILIDADGVEDQLLAEDWLKPVALADLLTGGLDLHQRIEFQALSGQPAAVRLASVPIYPRWARPVLAEPPKAGREGRRFVVEVCGKVVRVEGVRVIAPQAGPRLEIFRILWDCFLDDLKRGMPPEQFQPKPIRYIAEELQARLRKRYGDEMALRRNINRLQTDIMSAIQKQLGLPIGREDIVQTCPLRRQSDRNFGYRLNPFTVLPSPFRADTVNLS